MKRKLLTASAVTSYIFTFIYALVTALFYSVSEDIYVLFLVLMVLSICLGLYNESLKRALIKNDNKLSKRDNIILLVLTVLSIINFPAFIHICRFISLSPYNMIDVIPNLLKNISIVTSTNLINP